MRRTLGKLEEAIRKAKSKKGLALAYYKLGLFHDNNSREAEAILNYEKAVKLGLDDKTKAKALAWLASSMYKTGRPGAALKKLNESSEIAEDKKLKSFLVGLKVRIESKL